MFPRALTLLFLAFPYLLSIEATIHRLQHRDVLGVRRQGESPPIRDLQSELRRLKRSSGNPTFNESVLNDGNNRGLVHYSGSDSKVIFVLTYRLIGGTVTTSTAHLSTDYGYTFTNISSRIGNGATLANNIFVSPKNFKKVYFVDATSSKLYISEDEGGNFTTRTISPSTINPRSLLVHPKEDWVLAHDPVNNALYVSRDLGKTTFEKISDSVTSTTTYQWGEYPYDKDSSLVYFNTGSSSSTIEVDLYTQHYPYDDSTKKEFDPLLGPHDDFLIAGRYIFAQKTINSARTLWVSADREPFRQAHIPSSYKHQSYIVGDIRSIQALVIIRHTNDQYNLYMSEEKGVLYYLALSDIKARIGSGTYIIDLELVESMNYTTYIANQNVRSSSTDTSPSVRTLISFDVGGNWESVKPPTSSDSECIQPLCSLHLHMSTSEYWRTGVYSQESAPGIIIAHGVTGQYLDSDAGTNLFISRDGGATWSQTLDGTWGVSVLDHGGLIVAARDYHNGADDSRTLMYTCNEGDSWSQLTFTNENTIVYGVITEPGETTTVVSLYGFQSVSWVVVTVNFTNIFSSVCGSDDYYNWTPFDENTDTGCLLGASVTIERRKPSHCCLNGKKYNRELNYSICACSEEDFECDYGYKHANGINGPCVRDQNVTLDVGCGNGSLTYTQSQGYYRIGGDVCVGGVEKSFAPVEIPCCHGEPSIIADTCSASTKTTLVTTTQTVTSAQTINITSTETNTITQTTNITQTIISTKTTKINTCSANTSTKTTLVTTTETVTSAQTINITSTETNTITQTTNITQTAKINTCSANTSILHVATCMSALSSVNSSSNLATGPMAPTAKPVANSSVTKTASMVLGSLLFIAVLVIIGFIATIVICKIKCKPCNPRGYRAMPVSYHSEYRDESPPADELQNITHQEDEKPLEL